MRSIKGFTVQSYPSDLVLIPVQPSPADVWATAETADLVAEAPLREAQLGMTQSFNPGYSGIIRDDPGMRLSRAQRLTCVILYLYGYSHFERYGVMPFGELKHGAEGLREDLASLFGRASASSSD